MAETKRYLYFAIVDKPNHPEDPNRKPRRTSYVYKNTAGGTDPKTGEVFRAECPPGVTPNDAGIYTVDMESTDANLKLMAMNKAVKRGVNDLFGPFDSITQAVKEQQTRRPKTEKEQLVAANARIAELEMVKSNSKVG